MIAVFTFSTIEVAESTKGFQIIPEFLKFKRFRTFRVVEPSRFLEFENFLFRELPGILNVPGFSNLSEAVESLCLVKIPET